MAESLYIVAGQAEVDLATARAALSTEERRAATAAGRAERAALARARARAGACFVFCIIFPISRAFSIAAARRGGR